MSLGGPQGPVLFGVSWLIKLEFALLERFGDFRLPINPGWGPVGHYDWMGDKELRVAT